VELVRQKAYRKTFDIACSRLTALPVEERLRNAGLPFRKEGDAYRVELRFFDEDMEMTIPAFEFKSKKGSNVTLTSKIVILHYIIAASGEPVGSDPVPYEDVPGCRPYAPVFERRVTKPLLSAFGFARDSFMDAGLGLGGLKEDYGDSSFTLRAFPRLPITFILWEGDDDFPPSIKVLFDRSIDTYLPLEDIVVVSKMAATRIIKQARKEYGSD
jgi:hypothetical protein